MTTKRLANVRSHLRTRCKVGLMYVEAQDLNTLLPDRFTDVQMRRLPLNQ